MRQQTVDPDSFLQQYAVPASLTAILVATLVYVLASLFHGQPADTRPPPAPRAMFAAAGSPQQEAPPIPEDLRTVSREELAQKCGSKPDDRVWLAVKGLVFDVSQGAEMYRPGKSYSVFAGKDASRALAKSSLSAEDATDDLAGLSPEEVRAVAGGHIGGQT